MSSIIDIFSFSSFFHKTSEHFVFEEELVTFFASMNSPLLKHIFLVLNTICSNLKHIVFGEFMLLFQFLQGFSILRSCSLSINIMFCPWRNFFISLRFPHFIKIKSIIDDMIILHHFLFFRKNIEQKLDSKPRHKLTIKSSSVPYNKFGPRRQYSISPTNFPYRPSLHIKIIDIIHSLSGKNPQMEWHIVISVVHAICGLVEGFLGLGLGGSDLEPVLLGFLCAALVESEIVVVKILEFGSVLTNGHISGLERKNNFHLSSDFFFIGIVFRQGVYKFVCSLLISCQLEIIHVCIVSVLDT